MFKTFKKLIQIARDNSVQIQADTVILGNNENRNRVIPDEHQPDCSLLSEALSRRKEREENRRKQVVFDRAVEIEKNISDEALLGLTIAQLLTFWPACGGITDGIEAMDNWFSKFLSAPLPDGDGWIEHLNALGAIQVSATEGHKNIYQLCSDNLAGYVDVGIKKNSDIFSNASISLKQVKLPNNIFVDHELREGYVRLPLSSKDAVGYITMSIWADGYEWNGSWRPLQFQMRLTDQQRQTVLEMYSLYENNEVCRNDNVGRLMNILDKYDRLKGLRQWWDSVPRCFTITDAGKVLAFANAHRFDPTIPASGGLAETKKCDSSAFQHGGTPWIVKYSNNIVGDSYPASGFFFNEVPTVLGKNLVTFEAGNFDNAGDQSPVNFQVLRTIRFYGDGGLHFLHQLGVDVDISEFGNPSLLATDIPARSLRDIVETDKNLFKLSYKAHFSE